MSRVIQSFQQVLMPGQTGPLVLSFPEVASSVFKAGDLVYLTGGDLTLFAGGTDAVILGVAREDASGVTAHRCLVEVLRPGVLYMGNLRAGTDTYTEATSAGVNYGVVRTAAGNWEIDLSETTTKTCKLIDTAGWTPDGKPSPALGGSVQCIWDPSKLQFGTIAF